MYIVTFLIGERTHATQGMTPNPGTVNGSSIKVLFLWTTCRPQSSLHIQNRRDKTMNVLWPQPWSFAEQALAGGAV